MKITFYTPMLKQSGGNIVMFKYAESLASIGHEVIVISPWKEESERIRNGVKIKTFREIGNKYIAHILFELIYLKKY